MHKLAIAFALLLRFGGGTLASAQTSSQAQQISNPPLAPPQAPLPPVPELLKSVEAHEERDEKLLGLYTYRVHQVLDDFDSKEAVKKTRVTDYESIPIQGVRVLKVVARDGKPLSPEEAAKENEHFDKAVEKARKRKDSRDAKADEDKPGVLTAARVLELGNFSNERRVLLAGRPTIVLDYAGDKTAKTRNRFERVVEDLVGTVWIDEQDKVLAQVEGHFNADFKVAAGLLADIGRGFSFHMRQAKVNGELWLPQEVGGRGKASAVLVFRVHGHMEATMSEFRKYHATSTIVGTNGAIDENGKPLEPASPEPSAPAPADKTKPRQP